MLGVKGSVLLFKETLTCKDSHCMRRWHAAQTVFLIHCTPHCLFPFLLHFHLMFIVYPFVDQFFFVFLQVYDEYIFLIHRTFLFPCAFIVSTRFCWFRFCYTPTMHDAPPVRERQSAREPEEHFIPKTKWQCLGMKADWIIGAVMPSPYSNPLNFVGFKADQITHISCYKYRFFWYREIV